MKKIKKNSPKKKAIKKVVTKKRPIKKAVTKKKSSLISKLIKLQRILKPEFSIKIKFNLEKI